ncbi:CsiV family protein [Neptuniibacter halophilus]|uniref:CsiV family protein n=1 Tax=Neptuniibacter halophilus TaxID=651666 RepID=UPI0025723AEA|nr:CsiV family protein [Neptuniibacter halophilus]
MKYLRLLALPFLLLTGYSQAADLFKVEVIAFANKDQGALSDEYWPVINEIPEKSRAIYLGSDSAGYQRLSGGSLNLHDEKNRLRNSGHYRILYHGGWVQPVYQTLDPRPIRIQAGEILDNGMYELDGYIAVGRGRYLHFRPDLYLSQRLSPAQTEQLKRSPGKQQPDTSTAAMLSMQSSSTAVSTLSSAQFPVIPQILTVHQDQARRMRSSELHYIDHPLLGIVVQITPVN